MSGFERSPLTNVTVARFSHANGTEPASAFSATITWGDGASSAGTVTLSNGTFYVLGSHRYTTPGVFTTRVTLGDGGTFVVAEGTATVLPATAGRLTDGTTMAATVVLAPLDRDSFTWQAVKRSIDGEEVDDLPPVKVTRVKRKR